MIEKIIAKPSATGTASQIPFFPIMSGNVINDIIKNTNVLNRDKKPEILPFENAVNNADVNILIPVNKNEIENI